MQAHVPPVLPAVGDEVRPGEGGGQQVGHHRPGDPGQSPLPMGGESPGSAGPGAHRDTAASDGAARQGGRTRCSRSPLQSRSQAITASVRAAGVSPGLLQLNDEGRAPGEDLQHLLQQGDGLLRALEAAIFQILRPQVLDLPVQAADPPQTAVVNHRQSAVGHEVDIQLRPQAPAPPPGGRPPGSSPARRRPGRGAPGGRSGPWRRAPSRAGPAGTQQQAPEQKEISKTMARMRISMDGISFSSGRVSLHVPEGVQAALARGLHVPWRTKHMVTKARAAKQAA